MNGTPGVEGRVAEAGGGQGEGDKMGKRVYLSGECAPSNPCLYGLREAKG